jgi:CspA family cold shock protein
MPTLNKYARSNEKTGYFVRASVGGNHPVTLQTTGTAQQIFKDNGYSDGSSIPTKLVWSMYDVDLLYTESSVSGATPTHSFDTLSDAVTGSALTEGTRKELIRYFRDYTGAHQKQVNSVLDELRREVTAGAIATHDSSESVMNARRLLTKYSSQTEEGIEEYLQELGEHARASLLVFAQRASQITDIESTSESVIAYQFAPVSLPGEATVLDHTHSTSDGKSGQYDYQIEYTRNRTSSIYVRNGEVQEIGGASKNVTSVEASRLAAELTPVSIDENDVASTVDAPSVSDVDVPERAFWQGDGDLLVCTVDRVSQSGNPVVELQDGHILLDAGEEGTTYLVDRVDKEWGRVLCELTRSNEREETVADTMPLLDAEAFDGADVEGGVVEAAASYHEMHHEIVAAQVSDGRLEYATRAVLPDGSPGPRCGFSVGGSKDDSTILEIVAHPDYESDVVEYGDLGIRHKVVLSNGVTEWETAVTADFENLRESRDVLLTHQVAMLQIMTETLDAHPGFEPDTLIPDVVSSGDLEDEIIHPAGVWERNTLLGDLFDDPESEPATDDGEKCIGTVDFFNDTGGYGFIETDACEDDVFYHMEDIGGPDITEGETLRFDIGHADKGPRAENIERV